VLEIILAIGVKTLSNYFNHLLHTPLDEMFAGREWKESAWTSMKTSPSAPELALVAVGGPRAAGVAIPGDVDDPEVDLRFDPSGAGTNTVTLGEPDFTVFESSGIR
jgi:hypothetical protein